MKSNVLIALGCVLPGSVLCLGSFMLVLMIWLSDGKQLMMDTGLERSTVMGWGWVGVLIGTLIVAVPVGLRVARARKNRQRGNQAV